MSETKHGLNRKTWQFSNNVSKLKRQRSRLSNLKNLILWKVAHGNLHLSKCKGRSLKHISKFTNVNPQYLINRGPSHDKSLDKGLTVRHLSALKSKKHHNLWNHTQLYFSHHGINNWLQDQPNKRQISPFNSSLSTMTSILINRVNLNSQCVLNRLINFITNNSW